MSFMTPEAIRRWEKEYHHCDNGLHVFQPEGGEFGGITLRNFPGVMTLDPVRAVSSAGEGDDWDLLVDLFENGDMIDNVAIRRQDLELLERAISSANELKEKADG